MYPDKIIYERRTITTRTILENFPHSQHRPVLIEYEFQILVVRSIFKPRWNFKLAKCDKYANNLDNRVKWIPPSTCNYDRFL